MIIPEKEIMLQQKKIKLRSATAQDAVEVCRHRRITSGETQFLTRYPEECDEDIPQIERELALMANDAASFRVSAFYDNHMIGDLGVTAVGSRIKNHHRAYLGISIQQSYCNMGLGKRMMETALEYAKKIGFEQVELGVFSDNERAIHLYEQVGFVRYGAAPKAFKLKDGSYRDEILMVRFL